MTVLRLIGRSLRFHHRLHFGVVLGAAVAAAVLVGALAVGDSVRESLRRKAMARLAGFNLVLHSHDRFFNAALSDRLSRAPSTGEPLMGAGELAPRFQPFLLLPGNLSRQDGGARANRVSVYGLVTNRVAGSKEPSTAWAIGPDEMRLSSALADQLRARTGDEFILRLHKPSALSRDAVVTPRDEASVALRLKFAGIIGASDGGDLSLQSGASAPLNVFLRHDILATASGLEGRANLILGRADVPSPERLSNRLLKESWGLADAELNLKVSGGAGTSGLELSTRRIFLDPAVNAAADSLPIPGVLRVPILTYLVNGLAAGERLAPYSMVTAAGSPWTPEDLGDDEVVVTDWLARDLGLTVGSDLAMTYYRADTASSLVEITNRFRVRSVVPMSGTFADRTLMPEFPGLAKAESTHEWDAGFELIHKIRDEDEAYWKKWRGTPKAYVTLKAGQAMWGNRFGSLTAVRWMNLGPGQDSGNIPASVVQSVEAGLRERLEPASVGLSFEEVERGALRGAAGGQDFGQLFIGFSFFLIVAALLLTALLFQFGLEQRAGELGALLAMGWPVGRVTGLFLREGVVLASLGACVGALGGYLYGQGVIWGLNSIWRDAVARAGLSFHIESVSVVAGIFGSVLVAVGVLWLSIRSAARAPARELLNEGVRERAWKVGAVIGRPWVAMVSGLLGILATGAGWGLPEAQRAGLFFGAGALMLIAVILFIRFWLITRLTGRGGFASSRMQLAIRAPSRKPGRSVATIALLASATFLIIAVGANKLDAQKSAWNRGSGTGGFGFWAESALPVIPDLDTTKGQELVGLDPRRMQSAGVRVVGMRVRDGDEASCLNLNQAQRPRLLGVNPRELSARGAFTMVSIQPGLQVTNGWDALQPTLEDEIPAIGDANSIQWALKRKIGDSLDYVDELGRPFKVRLVGAVANSILQGSLIIHEEAFTRRFPSESGRRAFLIDVAHGSEAVSSSNLTQVASEFSRALQDQGLELLPASVRLDRFNAVQNTYLNTFQVLGGLGLLLGSVGLGIVVLRNVFERRSEFAVLQAVGFASSAIEQLILIEHLVLLAAGLAAGALAASIVLLPAVASPGSNGLPWRSLLLTLLVVWGNGLVWTWIATRRALRGGILTALRGE
jgi:putative ABC transport system permease protein